MKFFLHNLQINYFGAEFDNLILEQLLTHRRFTISMKINISNFYFTLLIACNHTNMIQIAGVWAISEGF